MKALFVCTGNTCRSVMAQYLFEREARERGLAGWEARSCGLAVAPGSPVPAQVGRALRARGVGAVDHVPQPARPELLAWADAVYAMTRAHRDALWREYPEHRAKTQLFLEAAGGSAHDVEDPVGRPDAVYERCRDVLEQGIRSLIQRHAPSTADPRP